MTEVLDCRQVVKHFGSVVALDGIDLVVDAGSVNGFLGPNGAGKTTLIRIIVGLMRPTRGTVRVFGHDALDATTRRDLGFMPADPVFYPALTGRENLDLFSALQGRSPVARDEACEMLDLEPAVLDRPAGTYSSGMRQKLGIVQAVQHRPALVVLDEPANRLDPLAHRGFELLVKQIASDGGAVLLSSHTLSEVQETCDTVVMIHTGRVLLRASSTELMARALRSITVDFDGPVPTLPETVTHIAISGGRITARVPAARPDLLQRVLSQPGVRDLLVEPASLDEVFFDLYTGNGEADVDASPIRAHDLDSPSRATPAMATATAKQVSRLESPARPGDRHPSTRALIRAELVQRRRMLAGLAAGVFVFLLVLAGSYQAFGGVAGLGKTFGANPPSFFSAFAGEPGVNIFLPDHYLAFGFVHPLFLVLTLTVGLSVGSAAIAGDIETGRSEMLYARPVRRTSIFDARLALWFVAQIGVIGAAALGAYVGMRLSADLRAVGFSVVARVLVQYLPLTMVFGAVAFTASALARSRGQALGASIGAVALAYLVNFVALLWHPLVFARRITPFGYYSPIGAVSSLDRGDMALLVGVSVLVVAVARRIVVHRDLA